MIQHRGLKGYSFQKEALKPTIQKKWIIVLRNTYMKEFKKNQKKEKTEFIFILFR
jgi:hypothetical protein